MNRYDEGEDCVFGVSWRGRCGDGAVVGGGWWSARLFAYPRLRLFIVMLL